MKTDVLPLAEAIERLRSPYAPEDFSPLTGEPILVVALDSDARAPDAEATAAAEASLVTLPCPTVALASGDLPPPAVSLRDRFDVVVSSPAELEPILETARRTPIPPAPSVSPELPNRFAPEQNPRPAPVSTMALMSRLLATSSTIWRNRSSMSTVNALSVSG